jgi:hypothetical protein
MILPTSHHQPILDDETVVALIEATKVVKERIALKGLGRGNGGHGEMPCPVANCRGRVAYIVYTTNGHMMATCSHRGCLNVRGCL